MLPPEDVDAPLDRSTKLPEDIWQTREVKVTVSADDNGGTGVDYLEWRIDCGRIESSDSQTATFTVSADGVHVIQTRATDLAGHTSAWRTQQLQDRPDAARGHDGTTGGLDKHAHVHALRDRRDVGREQDRVHDHTG